jgi:glycosyltransferase involved in cell wall biosynthesis
MERSESDNRVLLQAGKAYDPRIGGIETVMREVAVGAATRGWGSRVLVASEDRRRYHESRNGVDVTRTPTLARPLSLPITIGYRHSLGQATADALLVHEPTLLAATALRIGGARLRRRFGRLVVWWHSDIVRQRALAPAYGPIIHHLLDSADRILVATPNHVTSSDTLPAYAEKIAVVPYGIDLKRYAWSAERAERVAALRRQFPDVPLIVNAGRLARYKGVGLLAHAMEQIGGAHLVVAGDGPCAADVADSKAARDGRITMLPHLAPEAFVDLLWAADIFVMPSIQNSEAFGIAQVEAMACSTPVITFDLPTGVTWVNRHEKTGLVTALGDVDALAAAVQRLVDDDSLRVRLGANAHQWASSTFGVDQMVESTLGHCSGSTSAALPVGA